MLAVLRTAILGTWREPHGALCHPRLEPRWSGE